MALACFRLVLHCRCACINAAYPRSEVRGEISFVVSPPSENCSPVCEIAYRFALFLVRTSGLLLVAYKDRVPAAITLAQATRVSLAAALQSASVSLSSLS